MTEQERKELTEKIDEYVDILADLNNARKIGNIEFSEHYMVFVSEGIADMIEAFGITEVETEPTINDRYIDGKRELWYAKWKRFHYRGIRFAGLIYISPAEEM